jgi:nitrite reductase/ring-hydroxylating ferredoxin subunit
MREPMADQNPEGNTVPPDGRPLSDQPKWRQDFPIDWPQDEYVSRRDLTKFMALTSMAFVAGQFWIVGKSALARPPVYLRRAIARVDQVPVGTSLVFGYPGEHDQRVLVRLGEEHYVAYDQKCTHLLCPVFPRVAEGVLHCPCHNGYFSLDDGRPISGPPQRPLPRVELEVEDGVIYATRVVLRTV